MRIISFDPGDNTGIVVYDSELNSYMGICVYKDFKTIKELILNVRPDLIIIEKFQLYPGKAKSLAWNTFYPCEVIGVIKATAEDINAEIVEQGASIKPYTKLDENCPKGNNHVKDAYMHLWYYLNMKSDKKKKKG